VSSVNFSLAALCGLWRRRAIHSARSSGRTWSALKPISAENTLGPVVSDSVCFYDILCNLKIIYAKTAKNIIFNWQL
jgi:hypothetical protein